MVVRDPISRFLSGYGNRIIHARALERHGNVIGRLQTEKLPILPDIGFFVDNMERYLDISPYVRNHLAPQCSVIGGIFDKINKIYPISRVHEIPEFFSKERGLHISLPHEQSAGPKFTLSHLSRQQVDKLVDFYKDDYNMLKDHYNAP